MTEDQGHKASEGSIAAAGAAKQRRKRKWDQPAEPLILAGVAVPGSLPLGLGVLGVTWPGTVPFSGPLLAYSTPAALATSSYSAQSSSTADDATAILQKLNQPKIQDELIAREIVINDAESTVRYKLTKRQTQEEIQQYTGAVVITRGKYRPPNGLPDGEKPLYLHISAGAHLKDMAERIKAVDRAAAMVEEILKQRTNSILPSTSLHSSMISGQVTQPLCTCLFLGFEADPSVNIVARIRGPNDQYINHIMNETGATVVLKGRGSGNPESTSAEEAQQPLHLYLSSANPKSLEDARILAENLLATISAECGASRIPSSKIYTAVPPPQQLLAGVATSVTASALTAADSSPTTLAFPHSGLQVPSGSNISPAGTVQPGSLYGISQSNNMSYPLPSISGGTSYSGYGGIYPQATPLQQVALALRQAPTSTAAVLDSTLQPNASEKSSSSSTAEADKPHSQRRKFQELPVASKGPTSFYQNSRQQSEFLKPGSEESGVRNVSSMPPPKKLILPVSNGMPPPPRPRSMPPPPPKFSSPPEVGNGNLKTKKSNSEKVPTKAETSSIGHVPDTLLKLMEYGEDDDDIDGIKESPENKTKQNSNSKPFWAV